MTVPCGQWLLTWAQTRAGVLHCARTAAALSTFPPAAHHPLLLEQDSWKALKAQLAHVSDASGAGLLLHSDQRLKVGMPGKRWAGSGSGSRCCCCCRPCLWAP